MAKGDLRLAKLFFDIEANTKGLQGELRSAERSFGRLATFVSKHPVAAMGALAAAAAAAGLAAGQMAAQFDTAVRKIAATIPNGTARLLDLKRAADQLATSKGLSSEQVLAGLSAIAKEGVTSLEALTARFEVLQRAADATGSEITALAGPFDQILDVFGLADAELEKVAATLAAISQERGVGFEDFLGAFQTAAPTIREAGLSFDEGAAALGRLLASGLSAKQTASQLKEEVQKLGREGMLALGGATRSASADLASFRERARAVEEGTERLSAALSERFTSRIRQIGDAINRGALDPLRQLAVTLTDPIFEGRNFMKGVTLALAASSGNLLSLFGELRRLKEEAVQPLNFGGGRGHTMGARFATEANRPAGSIPLTDEQKKAARAFAQELAESSARATATLVDDLEIVLEKFRAKFAENARGLTSAEIAEARTQINDLALLLDRLKAQRDLVPAERITSRTTLANDPLKLRLDTAKDLREQSADIADAVEREERARQKVAREIEHARDQVRREADEIERAVRGAVQLGEAFGILDDQLADVLTGISQVATELKVVAKNGLSFGSALTIVGGFASVLGGLFGESADDRRDREIREDNNRAIRELTKAIEDQIAGSTVSQGRDAVSALLQNPRRLLDGSGINALELDRQAVGDILAPLGLSLRELKDLAAEVGITLNTSSAADFVESLQQLDKALAEVDFRAFADSFAGQLAFLQARFDLLDLTNPADQLKELQRLASKNSPLLKELLGGLDLATAEGRAQAEQAVLDLLDKLGPGGTGLTADELGGLSSSELLDLIRQIEAMIDAINAQEGTGGATGDQQTSFGVFRGVTEITANRLDGRLLSVDLHLIEIRDLIAGFVPAFPPVIPFTGEPANVTFVVTVTGAPDAASAQAAGTQIGEAAADRFAQRLGAQSRRRALAFGSTVRA